MNPFETIKLEVSDERAGIETEITEFEERILSIKREIDTLESLIEINTFYKERI